MKKTSAKAHLVVAVAGFGGVLALGAQAQASGFGIREGSADWWGNAFAGSEAKAYDASTVWSNPAGMALLGNDEIDGAISLVSPTASFTGSATNAQTGGNVSGTEGGNSVAPAATGSTFAVLTLGPNWRLGISVTAPFGERTNYPGDFVGRYQGLSSSITDINFGLALSYKINDHLSIGGGPNFDYFQARLTEAVNVPVLSALTGQDPTGEIRGTSLGIGYNLGVLYQFDANTRIGLDYHSRIRHNITGGQYVSIPSSYSIVPAIGTLLAASNSRATTSITLPDSAGLGFYHQITPQLAVLGSVEWTEWSLLKTINITASNGSGNTTIQENWRNTWYAGLGANYQLTPKLMLQTGFAYDQSPVTNANRTVRIPDADHYDLGFGAQYQLLPSTKVELAYGHVFTPGGSIQGSAAASALTPSGTISGEYSASDNSVTAGLNTIF